MNRILDLLFLTRPLLLCASSTFYFAGAVACQRAIRGSYRLGVSLEVLPNLGLFLLIVSASFVVNQIHDVRGDAINRKNFILPSKAISTRASWVVALGLSALAAVLVFALRRDLAVVGLVVSGLALGFAYSVPPLRLKARPLLDMTANVLGFGFIGFALGWLVFGSLDGRFIAACAPYAAAMASVFLNTCIPDERGDRIVGDKTTCVVFGAKATARAALATLCLAVALAVAFDQPVCWIAGLASLPAFIAVAVAPEMANSVVASQTGARLLLASVSIVAPLLAGLGTATYLASRVYFRRRFGIRYPLVSGAEPL